MKKVIVILYLLGYVVAYCMTKDILINFNKTLREKYPTEETLLYSVQDRKFNLVISGFSWLTVAAMAITNFVVVEDHGPDKSKIPAKW